MKSVLFQFIWWKWIKTWARMKRFHGWLNWEAHWVGLELSSDRWHRRSRSSAHARFPRCLGIHIGDVIVAFSSWWYDYTRRIRNRFSESRELRVRCNARTGICNADQLLEPCQLMDKSCPSQLYFRESLPVALLRHNIW
jgi:hypothetical protein